MRIRSLFQYKWKLECLAALCRALLHLQLGVAPTAWSVWCHMQKAENGMRQLKHVFVCFFLSSNIVFCWAKRKQLTRICKRLKMAWHIRKCQKRVQVGKTCLGWKNWDKTKTILSENKSCCNVTTSKHHKMNVWSVEIEMLVRKCLFNLCEVF